MKANAKAKVPKVDLLCNTVSLILAPDPTPRLGHADYVLVGVTEADKQLVDDLSVGLRDDGANHLFRLISGARAARIAVLIRTDLPPLE